MIPPVEIRHIRPCEECILYYDDDDFIPTCNLEESTIHEIFKKRFEDSPTIKDYPCKYHLTREEYHELIDSGVIR